GRPRLPAPRGGGPSLLPEHGGPRRDRPPAAEPDSLGHAGLLDRGPSGFVSKEDHCETAQGPGNQSPREWQEEAGAVTGQAIRADRAAVPHPRQPFEQPLDDRARSTAARIGEEADAAGVRYATDVTGDRWHGVPPWFECGLPACCCDLAGVGGGMKRRLARKDAQAER